MVWGYADTDEESSDRRGYWSASAVARQLGMSTVTLRTWNRRYGIGPTGHRPGQHRSYSDADVWALQHMQRLIGSGVRPAAAARIAVQAATAAHPPGARLRPVDAADAAEAPAPNERLQILVNAAYHLDGDTARATLDVDLVEHGVIATWDELCRPALALISPPGPTVPCGRVDVEHLLSWCILVSLHKLAAFAPRPAPPILLACGESEHHTLALETLQAALRHNRIATRMLGADTPGEAIVRSFGRAQPASGAIVWSQRAATAHPELLQVLAVDSLVIAAGPGWDDLDLPDTVHRPPSLAAALDIVKRHMGSGT